MTAPIEVDVDRLVLHGVREPDVPAVLDAFRRHLAALLATPGTSLAAVTDHSAGRETETSPAVPMSERLGRELALAVARAVVRR
ncbi:hypothetical protein [Streptomyces sioyaensis]|uniref:hypothetical protein n=1 Tax=Streptomyces sioyaensis TaxID=67364 RepID=UPI0037A80F3A